MKQRDPARIPIILGALRVFWEQHPDLRLAQIIVGATRLGHRHLFYLEDDDLLVLLMELKQDLGGNNE